MNLLRQLSVRGKLTFIIALTSAAPLLLASVAFVLYESTAVRRDTASDLRTNADFFGAYLAANVASGNAAAVNEALATLGRRGEIKAARIYDSAHHLLAAYTADGTDSAPDLLPAGESERFDDHRLVVQRPIRLGPKIVGAIALETNLVMMHARIANYSFVAAGVALVGLLVAYGLGALLQRTISQPMSELTEMARRVATNQDFSFRAARHGDREVDRVITAFNGMLDQLQARDVDLRSARDELERRVFERTTELVREQARFQCIIDAAPIGLSWMLREHPETRIVNPAHVRISGVPASESSRPGRYREATHPDDRPAQDALQAKLLSGEIDHYDIDKRYVHPDGSIRWVTLSVRFQRDPRTGEMQEVNTIVDITDRRLAETAYSEASELLDAMMMNTPDLIYFKDRQSRFVHVSDAFAARFKIENPKYFIGKTDFDLFTPEHAQPAFADEQAIIRTGEPILSKLEKETYADGRVTWAMTTKLPWRKATGEIIGTFGVSKDVTELKEAEAKAAYERDLLQLLLDNFPETIYFKDLESRFARVSRTKSERSYHLMRDRYLAEHPGAVEMPAHLRSPADFAPWLIGKTDVDVYGPERALPLLEEEREIVRTGKAILQRVEQAKLPNGKFAWHVVTKLAWRDKDGRVIGTFGTSHDITPIKEAEEKLAETHKQLLEVSRQAGMAEVATGVLHNVGNVLNSINVSTTLVTEQVKYSKAVKVSKLAALFTQHQADLGDFITKDQQGKLIPAYIETLGESLAAEHQTMLAELDSLRKNVEHIKEIVTMQQAYARTSGVIETVTLPELVEDALRINAGSLARHDVVTERDYQARGVITTDKHKVIQILINLVRNAKYACDESGRTEKRITVRTTSHEKGIKIAVIDNGVGIRPENLTRIFSHGFTTRVHGHGFGLHSGAIAAKELGGALIVTSDGPDRGATFVLELPYKFESSNGNESHV